MGSTLNTDVLNRSMRLSVAEGGLATAMSALLSGVFLTGFALSLGASQIQIGILFTLPPLCAVAQLLGSYSIERHGNTKWLCMWTTAVSRLLYIAVLAVPLLASGLSANAKVWCVVGLMAVSHVFASLGGVAWLAWVKALVPANVRIPFFGRRNLANALLSFSVCLAGAAMLDIWGKGEHWIVGFAMVFLAAMACGVLGWFILLRIPAANATITPDESFRKKLLVPLRDGSVRRIIAFYATWNLAVNLAAPFIPVFYLQKLGLPFAYIMLLNTLNSLSGIGANLFWTRLAHRFGIKPVVIVATLGEAFVPLWLVFIHPDNCWLLVAIHLFGVFNTPITIGPDNFVLKLSPDRNASPYMAVFRAVVGPATALAAVLGGWLAGAWDGGGLLSPFDAGGLKLIFLISFVGRLVSLTLLAGVVEPGAVSVWRVSRVLQRYGRHLLARRLAGRTRLKLQPSPSLVGEVLPGFRAALSAPAAETPVELRRAA